MSEISPVPMTYAGVRFRSTLEADWAATLDSLGVTWQYEPEAVRLPSGELYRPDFYLPRIATWLEVKGPHGERLGKTEELARAVFHSPGCRQSGADWDGCCEWEHELVVVGLAPERGLVTWRLIDMLGGDSESSLTRCCKCGAWWWYSWLGSFGCRAHRRHQGGDDDLGETGENLPFARAGRGVP